MLSDILSRLKGNSWFAYVLAILPTVAVAFFLDTLSSVCYGCEFFIVPLLIIPGFILGLHPRWHTGLLWVVFLFVLIAVFLYFNDVGEFIRYFSYNKEILISSFGLPIGSLFLGVFIRWVFKKLRHT